MNRPHTDDRRLARLTEICLALPEADHDHIGDHSSFSVRKKKFAYYLNNHHGDGIVSVCFRTERTARTKFSSHRIRRGSTAPPTSAREDGSAFASTPAKSTGKRSRISSPTATAWLPPSASQHRSPPPQSPRLVDQQLTTDN